VWTSLNAPFAFAKWFVGATVLVCFANFKARTRSWRGSLGTDPIKVTIFRDDI